MTERSPSAYPSYKSDPVTAWMAVAGSGLIPRKATFEPLILPANRSSVAYPLAGRGPRARFRGRRRRQARPTGPLLARPGESRCSRTGLLPGTPMLARISEPIAQTTSSFLWPRRRRDRPVRLPRVSYSSRLPPGLDPAVEVASRAGGR